MILVCIHGVHHSSAIHRQQFTMDFCGHGLERAEFIQAAMNISQKYLVLQQKKQFFVCAFHTLTRSSHVCVCMCFSSLFYLHNLALDFIIFAIFSGIFERSFSSGSGTFEYANGLGGEPPVC